MQLLESSVCISVVMWFAWGKAICSLQEIRLSEQYVSLAGLVCSELPRELLEG